MKKSLSEKDISKVSNLLDRFNSCIEKKSRNNPDSLKFYEFHSEFIRGVCYLIMIEDPKFREILTNTNEFTIYTMWAYIRNLKEEHPIYKYLRRFISLPDFFQRDIIQECLSTMETLINIDITF